MSALLGLGPFRPVAGIRLGTHLVQPKDTPLSNVWMTLLKGSGVDVDRFGDSTGVVAELQSG